MSTPPLFSTGHSCAIPSGRGGETLNKQRKKAIARLAQQVSAIASELEALKEEEDEARENMPENLWESDRYEVSEECSQAMEDALDSLESAASSLSEIT